MNLVDVLKETKLFKGAKDNELEKIAEFGEKRNFSKGDVIFKENSEGNEFYIVVGGRVAINKNVAGGRKRNLSNLQAGDVFGELALFDSEPRSADAEVIEDSEILVFDNKKFRELLKTNLVLAFMIQTRIIRILCQRLRKTDEMLNEGVIWGFKMEL